MSQSSGSKSDDALSAPKRGHSIKHFTRHLFNDASKSVTLPVKKVKKMNMPDLNMSLNLNKFGMRSHRNSMDSQESKQSTENEEEKDIAKPIGTKPDSIVNMLTHASIYAGMSGKLSKHLYKKSPADEGKNGSQYEEESEESFHHEHDELHDGLSKFMNSAQNLNEDDAEKLTQSFMDLEQKTNVHDPSLEKLMDNLSMSKSLDDLFQKQQANHQEEQQKDQANDSKHTKGQEYNPTVRRLQSQSTLPSINSSIQTLRDNDQNTLRLQLSRPPTLFELSVVENLEPSSITHSISLESQKSITEKQKILLKVSHKLQKVFHLNDDDIFIHNYSCWLIKDVLLQGHLYLTKENILFFAFLPKTYLASTTNEPHKKNCEEVVIQSGSLGFKSKSLPLASSITRFWAVLKFNNFSVYTDSISLYFPTLVIDLKTCIRAELIEDDNVWFKVVTEQKTHKFHTDSTYVARQWVFNLTKLIFQHNNSNSRNEVLIKIPISNIIDIEKTPLIEDSHGGTQEDLSQSAETGSQCNVDSDGLSDNQPSSFRIKYMENDIKDTSSANYGIDEIYFMFFLKSNSFHQTISKLVLDSNSSSDSSKSNLNENVKFTPPNKTNNSPKISATTLASVKSPKPEHTGRPSSNSISSSLSKIRSNLRPFSRKYNSDSSLPEVPSRSQALSPNALKQLKSGDLQELDFSVSHSRNYLGSQILDYPDNESCNETDNESTRDLKNVGTLEAPAPITPNNKGSLLLKIPSDDDSLNESVDDSTVSSRWNPKFLLKGVASTGKALYNVSNMWSSEPSHYNEINSMERGAEDPYFIQSSEDRNQATENFQKYFSLSKDKKLIASYYTYLQKNVPIYGKIYLGESEICFRSLLPGVNTKMILPLIDIENCYKEKGFRFTYSGLVIVIHGHEELFFEFSSSSARDDCELLLLKQLETRYKFNKKKFGESSMVESEVHLASSRIDKARIKLMEDRINATVGLDVPIIAEDNAYFKTSIRPKKSYKFTLLTIGSRGDVQPYIALGKGLIAEGHQVTIATHAEFEEWILSHDLKFREIAGNPAELMSLMVTHGTMSVAFLKEASSKFRGWITELLETSWKACQNTEILIESPSAMSGIHIAEALCIPYFRAFTMPWTRTRAYPHAFIVPDQKRGGSYNYLTHVMFENIFWKGISGQVNKWRVETLKLPKTNLDRLQQTKVPFMYNISPAIFPPSVDFSDWVKVTGYWFLDEGKEYKPPKELLDFVESARRDKKKLIYIGFGSIVVSDSKSLTEAVTEAVLSSDVRCILNKGWSDRLNAKDKNVPEIELPPEIYNSGSIPHDWLFPQIDAAVHHGGSGTTGATMRAGLPTIIKPFFGDQFFYANRVEDIGAGVGLKKLNAKSLAKAIKQVTTDTRIIEKAKIIGKSIRNENGVLNAIEVIYNELEYARTLIVNKQQANKIVIDNNEEVPSDGEDSTSDSSWLVV